MPIPTPWLSRPARLSITSIGLLVGGGFAFIYLVLFPSSAAALPGTWTVASGSRAGYRVREQLAGIAAQSDAVGRTQSITGTATISDTGATLSVTGAMFTVDVSTL